MIADAPVVYDKQQDIRQLLTDEVRRVGALRPQDYFTPQLAHRAGGRRRQLYAPDARRSGRAPRRRTIAAPRTVPAGRRVPPTRLRIIGTNDFHGALEPRTDSRGVRRGGAAYLATAIRRARAECVAPAVRVAARRRRRRVPGDAGVEPRVRPPGRRHLQSSSATPRAALGNHEFDWGQDTLRARMREARYRLPRRQRAIRRRPRRAVDPRRHADRPRTGLKIGVIGLASVLTARTTAARNVVGLGLPRRPVRSSTASRAGCARAVRTT